MRVFFIVGLVLAGGITAVQGQAVTLNQAVEQALARGADLSLWAANLEASQATWSAAQARAGLSLTSSLSYSASQTWSDPTVPYTSGSALLSSSSSTLTTASVGSATKEGVLPQSAGAAVTLGTPLTTLTVRATENFQTTPRGDFTTSPQGSASLTQVLWNGYPGGTAQATAEKAALTWQVAQWNAQASRNRLVLTVKQAYFTLLSAQENLAQLVQTRDQRRDSLRFVQTKFDLGQATPLDLKQAKINVQTADLDLQAGTAAHLAARSRLANLMGQPDSSTLTVAVEPAPEIGVASLEDAVALALKQRIEPQVAQANARAAQIDALVAWGASTPTVTLTGGLTYVLDPAESTSYTVGTVGLTVGAPLIDSGLAAAQQTLAQAQKTVAQGQYDQTLRSIPVDVEEAWHAWQVALGRLEVSGLALEVAQGQRQVVQAQYDAGLKTIADLQTSDIALSTAELTLLKAKITAQLSSLTLLNILGQ